jgi:hypothetical protein
VPYPSKYFVTYGEPLRLHEDYPQGAAHDPVVLERLAAQVREEVEALVERSLARRGGPR